MKRPAQLARQVEERPQLPAGTWERLSRYGVMGLPFRSGHVLGLRRWTASSVGEGFTSIWHRNPQGRWTFYESVAAETACTRYFGADVDRARTGMIRLEWKDDRCLRVCTVDSDDVDWTIEMAATPVTRVMSLVGPMLPARAWRSRPVLSAMGAVAGRALRAGTMKLTGTTSNGQRFIANPLRIWRVTDSRAVVEGQELGPIGPLPEQAHLGDFYMPQHGIVAFGRVLVSPATVSIEARAAFR